MKKHDIFHGAWEKMGEGGERPTYRIPTPKKWPVQEWTRQVIFRGRWTTVKAIIWLN